MAQAKALNLLNLKKRFYFLTGIVLLAGFALTIISWLQICSTSCAAVHQYRLHGFHFESIGLLFFPMILACHFLSRQWKALAFVTSFLLAGALGAECMFVLAQKFIIGHWCPICLSIAGCIIIANLAYAWDYILQLKTVINQEQRSEIMRGFSKAGTVMLALIAGFLFAATGIAKYNPLQAEETSLKESLAFGNLKSPIEVYLFTDWSCPACRKLEPNIVTMAPEIMKKARLTFVDFAIHSSTLNFTPYHLAFIIHNKSKYFELRDALTRLGLETETPSDQDIERMTTNLKTSYQQLNYADVALATKYYNYLSKEFNIDSTPTMVIINRDSRKGKKFYGVAQITEKNILKAIETLQKS